MTARNKGIPRPSDPEPPQKKVPKKGTHPPLPWHIDRSTSRGVSQSTLSDAPTRFQRRPRMVKYAVHSAREFVLRTSRSDTRCCGRSSFCCGEVFDCVPPSTPRPAFSHLLTVFSRCVSPFSFFCSFVSIPRVCLR